MSADDSGWPSSSLASRWIAAAFFLASAVAFAAWAVIARGAQDLPPDFALSWTGPTSSLLLGLGLLLPIRRVPWVLVAGVVLTAWLDVAFVLRNGWLQPFAVFGIRYAAWIAAPLLLLVGAGLLASSRAAKPGFLVAGAGIAVVLLKGVLLDWGPQEAALSPAGIATALHTLFSSAGYLVAVHALWTLGSDLTRS